MEISSDKSIFLHNELSDNVLEHIKGVLPFNMEPLDIGIKYLGYYLKLNNYGRVDWNWLIKKIEKKFDLWCYRWLSLGGRVVLIKYVLENIPLFWFFMAKIPKGILENIQ